MPGSLETSHQKPILTLTPETPGSLLGLLTEEARAVVKGGLGEG